MLLYHVLAANWPSLQDGINLKPSANPAANLLIFSPAHVVWLGLEAVWFFFVLSGFVLTKMATRPGFSWGGYYPSRIVRLYGPVLFAIVLAWLSYRLIPHVAPPGASPYLTALPSGYTTADVIHDATLLGGTSNSIGVLWSLQWEVLFSLALPAYLFVVRKHPIIGTIIALAGSVVGWLYLDQVLMYMPFFFFGALLAQYWDRVLSAFSFLGRGGWLSHVLGVLFVLLSIVAVTSYFELGIPLGSLGLNARAATLPIVLAGMLLIIITSIAWPPLSRLLTMRGLVFLGTISFSLYLVHRPIMIAYAYTLNLGPLSAVLAIVTSLAVATGFYYAIERPIHRFAQRINARVKGSEAEKPVTEPAQQSPAP